MKTAISIPDDVFTDGVWCCGACFSWCVMVEPLQSNRTAIAAACARHSVVRLEAFGSALRDDFVPGQSDVDLLVEFVPLESYALVGAVKNPYIARAIEREKQLLYAA